MKRPRTCSHADPTPTRVCRVEYLVPYDFLDLRIFVKFLLIFWSNSSILHSLEISNYNYLRDLYIPSRISLHIHRDFSRSFLPARPLSSRESFPWITLHLARLNLISSLAGFTRQRTSVCRAHSGTFHLYTRTLRTQIERKRKRIHIHQHRYTGYTLGARARTRSRDGRSAWMHGRRRRNGAATGSSTEEVYAPSEGCMRRGRSRRRRLQRRRRRRYGGGAAARTISHGERSYRFWPAAPADRYSWLR